jgi:hypothetical protein
MWTWRACNLESIDRALTGVGEKDDVNKTMAEKARNCRYLADITTRGGKGARGLKEREGTAKKTWTEHHSSTGTL